MRLPSSAIFLRATRRPRSRFVLEQLEQRTCPSGIQVQYATTQDWGTGFQAQMSLVNTQPASVPQWHVAFDFAPNISSIWDATIVSHTGSHYVVAGASWNSTLPANGSVSFGFIGNPGNVSAGPANIVVTSGSSGNGANQPPVAKNDSALTTPGQPVTVNVLANDSDPDGDPLTLTSVTQPHNGTVVTGSGGNVTYTPHAGFIGNDSFSYVVNDGRGATASATVTINVAAPTPSPQHVFAPYVDMTAWPTYNLATALQAGVKYFNLAFIVADAGKQPSWGGYSSYELGSDFSNSVRTQINAVRTAGGDVAVSFGGENGQELAQADTNVTSLKNAYAAVVSAYGLSRIDFDIEGGAVADHASIDRRSQAIAALQHDAAAAGRTLQVWFTLPVLPTGLTADGLYVLQSALRYGVTVGGVNGMAMDFGDWAAPHPQGQMGTYAIDVAQSLFTQLQSLYGTQKTSSQLWAMVGVTPMLGVNDASDEIFTLADAQQLETFASQHGLGELAMWSLNRDQQAPTGVLTYASPSYSGVLQSPFAFSKIFEPFTL